MLFRSIVGGADAFDITAVPKSSKFFSVLQKWSIPEMVGVKEMLVDLDDLSPHPQESQAAIISS